MIEDVAAAPQSKSPPVAKVVVAVVVLAIVVIAALAVHWWTHPSIFGDLGDSYRSEPLPVADAALSTTVIFPKIDGEPETVTIDRAQAVFVKNTAEATARFYICHMEAQEDPIYAVHDPEETCHDIVPFEAGASFRHGVAPGSDYLFVTITPTHAGVAHLDRVDVTYNREAAHLYQRGTESISVDRVVIAK